MTRAQKRQFVRSLCRSIEKQVVGDVHKMPEEWDGHELRELLARLFEGERTGTMRDGRSARRKAFTQACYERNL